MITYKFLARHCDEWHDLPPYVAFEEEDFKLAEVKINGIVYTAYSPEFAVAFNKAKTWDTLSYDRI